MGQALRSKVVAQLAQEAEGEKRCIYARHSSEDSCLRRAHKSGWLISPLPQLYARKTYWDTLKPREQALHVLRALQQLHPDWVFAGPSAALVHGLSVSYADVKAVCIVTSRHSHTGARQGIRRQIVEDDSPCEVNGLRATSLIRTTLDCLRSMDFPHGLAVADTALRASDLSREQLLDGLASVPGNLPGRSHALATATHADARAESGGESMARARMIAFGYELPDLQVEFTNQIDGNAYFADFGWRLTDGTCWLVGELDGIEKYLDPQMTAGRSVVQIMSQERLRESRISLGNVKVMRFSFADMMDDRRFTQILDAYGVPKASEPLYTPTTKPFVPREPCGRCKRTATTAWR